jgi:hypothetical protein
LSKLIQINNQEIDIKEVKGQRVVTFRDIDLLHDRAEGTAGRNFRDNRKHFVENQDFYYITGEELKQFKQTTNFVGSNARELILITESGYLLLVKSFTDDLAWKVQRELVNSYFRVKEVIKPDNMKVISLIHAEVGELIAATSQIESRVESLENTMTIDYSQQLVLQEIAKFIAIEAMGGKDSSSYKDSSLRSSVFAAVWRDYKEYFQVNSYKNTARVDFGKAKEYLKSWKAQGKILREIENTNNQVLFKSES